MTNQYDATFVQGAAFGLLLLLAYLLWDSQFIVPAVMAFLAAFALSWPFWAGSDSER